MGLCNLLFLCILFHSGSGLWQTGSSDGQGSCAEPVIRDRGRIAGPGAFRGPRVALSVCDLAPLVLCDGTAFPQKDVHQNSGCLLYAVHLGGHPRALGMCQRAEAHWWTFVVRLDSALFAHRFVALLLVTRCKVICIVMDQWLDKCYFNIVVIFILYFDYCS